MAAHDTTTIRVRHATKTALAELAERRGTTIQDTAGEAAEALWREDIARSVRLRLDELLADPAEWAEFLADGHATEVGDGVIDRRPR